MTLTGIPVHDFPFVHTVAMEVTSKCNLQCTYCMVSQPDYKGIDMPGWMAEELIAELKVREVEQLCINGHGETTARKGWHLIFQPVVNDFKISIITNMARPLSAEELGFLSQVDSICVSLDTVDPSLLREIRRSLDLDVVVQNILDIRLAAVRRSRPSPGFVLFAGVYDRNVLLLEELVVFAITMGFSRIVFWGLVKHPDVRGASNVNTLLTMAHEDQDRARDVIERSIRILETHGIPFEFVGGFFEVFTRHIDDRSRARPDPPANRIFVAAPEGFTKDCFDPWNYSQIKANGEVYPCCARGAIGRVDKEHRYKDVLEGEALKTLRRRLLTGDLDAECRCCHMRANIPIGEFQARYQRTFNASGQGRSPITAPPWRHADEAPARSWSVRSCVRALRSVARTVRHRTWRHGVLGHVDSPAAGPVWSRQLLVSGWCFSPKGAPVTGRVFVDGVYCGDVTQTRARADVQRVFSNAPLICGFAEKVRLPVSIQPGRLFSIWIELDGAGTGSTRIGLREMTLEGARADQP